MATTKSRQSPTPERGVALIMVILVLLVLTVIGITAAMLMTQEDRISSRQDLQKAALYAAEVGLRKGEQTFIATAYDPDDLNAFLSHSSASSPITAAAPDPRPVQPIPWDNHHLGTYLTEQAHSAAELVNREVTQDVSASESFNRIRAFYSVYVRNNPEDRDPATGLQDPLVNHDTRLRLVAVGFITDVKGVDGSGNANVLAVKILEEEFNWTGFSENFSSQKLLNPGGTSSGVYDAGS